MHNIGEYVVYGGNGVMTVVDIREEAFGGDMRPYYVLREVGTSSASLTFVPTDNERLVSLMRPLLTRDEIYEIIHSLRNLPDCTWAKDSRSRSELFKRIMESGDRGGILAMIRTIYKAGLRREEEGKKNFISDENAMHKAEKLVYSEFSLVLGIPEEEIPELIKAEYEK